MAALTPEQAAALGLPATPSPVVSPLSAAEAESLGLPQPPAAPAPEKPLGERVATGVRQFFDPTYGTNKPNDLGPVVRQALKAASFLVPAAKVAQGAGLLAKVGAGAMSGAPAGALYGLGASESDTLGGNLGDAADGAVGGAIVGGAIPVVGAAAKWAAPKLRNFAVEQGRKALSGIGTALSARKEIPEAAVEAAYSSGAIRPLATIKGIAERLGIAADDLGQTYVQILKDLEAKGVTGPDATTVALDLLNRAAQKRATSLGSTAPGTFESAANELVTKQTLPGGALPLSTAEAIKRNLQFEAQREYDKISRQFTTTGEAKKELAAVMRGAIEDAVSTQAAKAPAEAAAFEPVKKKLSNLLQASKVAEEGAARAARRKTVGLTDTIAGTGLGAATGNPVLGVLGAFGHGIADRRLASTLGSTARRVGQGLEWLGGANVPGPVRQAVAIEGGANPEMQAMVEALRRRIVFGPSMAPAEEGQ